MYPKLHLTILFEVAKRSNCPLPKHAIKTGFKLFPNVLIFNNFLAQGKWERATGKISMILLSDEVCSNSQKLMLSISLI